MDKNTKIIVITLIVLGTIGFSVTKSLEAQKDIQTYQKKFNQQWKELGKESYIDFNDPRSDIHLFYNQRIWIANKNNILPSRAKYKKLANNMKHDEDVLKNIFDEFKESNSVDSSEFSIEEEQARIKRMNVLFDTLNSDSKKQFASVKYTIETIQESLDIIKDYSNSYYVPIEKSHLIPTQSRFPLDTKVAEEYRDSISTLADKAKWEESSMGYDEDDNRLDIRENQPWEDGAYGILSWKAGLTAYIVDLTGDDSMSQISNSLNMSSGFKDILSGMDTKKKDIEYKNPNDMSKEELSNGVIDSLGSAYYEKALQDKNPSITSVLTPSQNASWILLDKNEVVLKASFNHLNDVIDLDKSIASFNMTDEKTKKSFDIIIDSSENDSYRIEGDTPIGRLNNTYTKKSKVSTKKGNSSTSEKLFSPEEIAVAIYLDNFLNQFPNKTIEDALVDTLGQPDFVIATPTNGIFMVNQSTHLSNGVLSSEITISDDNISSKNFNGNQLKYEKQYVNKELTKTYINYQSDIQKIIAHSEEIKKTRESPQTSKMKTKEDVDKYLDELNKETDDPTGNNTLQGDTGEGEDASNPFN
ncbi:hypothetical protein ESZ54_10065 [Vagococcus silagei]|uniref:Uncharacterized protein n=1 Tax=Vagococcus silagei TaxID=2508885 RepID=A0A4S3B2F0_9ENTE|nr:hypothetical protein [Vagococcus silagei]THB60558.1 hypothetical protein ESZ54_10065 [Vagococcus silagei]